MAKIQPINLSIAPNPNNNGKFLINISYVVSAGPNDSLSEQNYREVCELIGDDTPGDGTDDIIRTISDGRLVFDNVFSHIQRSFQLELSRSDLDEDNATAFQNDEIRARVTLTPIPTSRESNQVVMANDPVNQ